MAERSQEAQERVREEFEKNPEATTAELQAAAASVEPSIAELSLRQFNAGYVLPLKRARAAARKPRATATRRRVGGARKQETQEAPRQEAPARARASAAGGVQADREQVRAVLLDFARDFSEADSRSAIVGVLSDLDRYVNRILNPKS